MNQVQRTLNANLNDSATVTLTMTGAAIYNDWMGQFPPKHRVIVTPGQPINLPLRCLMQIFGPSIFMGMGEPPFTKNQLQLHLSGRVFTRENTRGATTYDMDSQQKLGYVMSVDVDAGEVVRAHLPLRLVGSEFATFTERYRSIYPIYGGQATPLLFHCYGRRAPAGNLQEVNHA